MLKVFIVRVVRAVIDLIEPLVKLFYLLKSKDTFCAEKIMFNLFGHWNLDLKCYDIIDIVFQWCLPGWLWLEDVH